MARKKKIILHPTSRTRAIELDGKRYTVVFNFHAYTVMKELTGISLLMGWDTAFDAREYACFLYAGLITHHPDVELQFCFDSLCGETFIAIEHMLWDAYKASMPRPKEDANPQKPIAN
jgi:hypothetical protein